MRLCRAAAACIQACGNSVAQREFFIDLPVSQNNRATVCSFPLRFDGLLQKRFNDVLPARWVALHVHVSPGCYQRRLRCLEPPIHVT